MRAINRSEWFLRLPALGAWFLALLLLSSSGIVQSESSLSPQYVDARQAVDQIVASLGAGHASTADKLRRLGFGNILAEVSEGAGAGYSRADFSARTLIEYVYNRAEASKPGEGKRLLALLRSDEAKGSASIVTDERLAFLSGYSKADLARPFVFKPLDAVGSTPKEPMPQAVSDAITVLSEHLADRGVGQGNRINVG